MIRLAAHERDTQSFRPEATGTTDTVEIGIGVGRKVVINGEVDALNVNATTEDIGGNANPLVEFFELFVTFDTVKISGVQRKTMQVSILPFLLTDAGMDCYTGEVAFTEQFV